MADWKKAKTQSKPPVTFQKSGIDIPLSREKKLHLLVLSSTFPRWKDDPTPAFVFELCRRLKQYFDITVLTPRTPGAKDFENIHGLRIIRYPYFFRPWETLTGSNGGISNQLKSNPLMYLLVPFFLVGQIRAILQLLYREKIDAVHAHWIIPQGVAAAMAMILTGCSTPLICTSHGGDLYTLQWKLFQKLKAWVIHRSRLLTVVSRAMKDRVVNMGIPAEKVTVISMGVDLKKRFVLAPHKNRDTRELLFVGRLVEKKGVTVLLDAMPRVLAGFPDVRLTVVGSGPLESELYRQCRSLGISDNVEFLGSQPQSKLPEFYQRAALAVFPFVRAKDGDQEGLGLVVVEAMGCGCPVVAGDLPAINDTVIHEKTGLVFFPGNPKALAQTIITALQHPEEQKKMAQRAIKKVHNEFDWNVITQKYGACLKEGIQKN